MKKDHVIAGNEREGRLWSTGYPNRYIGERLVRGGKFEERVFNGNRNTAHTEWNMWRMAVAREATISVPSANATKRMKKGEQMSSKSQSSQAKQPSVTTRKEHAPESMCVLNFVSGRTVKNIALYMDADEALRMAESLTVALEVSGVDGSYDVVELPLWG